MTPSNVLSENQQLPVRSFAYDLWRAIASLGRALNVLCRWTLLARHTDRPCAELMRYRRELLADSEFQSHLTRCLRDVHYIMPEAAELYAIVRAAKPRVVVETGVASGAPGRTHVRLDMPESLRDRWKLQLGNTWMLLPDLLKSLDRLDLFLHDSDHSYEAMLFEFEQAYAKLEPAGLLLSDDTHLHAAWDDFCAKHGLRPGRVGHLGVARKLGNAWA